MKDTNMEKSSQKSESRRYMSSRSETPEAEEGGKERKQLYQNVSFPRHEYAMSSLFPRTARAPRKPFFSESMSDTSRPLFNMQERYVNNTEVKYAVDYIQKVKSYYPDDSDVFENFLEVMKDFKQGRLTTEEVAKIISHLFKDNEALVTEFRKFLPQEVNYITRQDTKHEIDGPRVVELKTERIDKDQAVEFVALAKQRFANDSEMYTRFIRLLAFLKNKPVPEGKFRELEVLLMDYPDLLAHLHRFIPDSAIAKVDEESPFSTISEKLREMGVYTDFIKCINAFNQNLISGKDLVFLLRPLLKDEALISEVKGYIKYDEVEFSSLTAKKLRLLKKIGSYRILPEEYKVSYEENGDILNRVCVGCPTHNREDEQYVFLKRNVYEEAMFRVEDERFEADLLLNRCDSLILSLEGVQKKIDSHQGDSELSVNDLELPLGIAQELLESVYGNASDDVLEGILSRPKEVIPIVLNRLYLVNREWRSERAKKNKVWDECVRKNHYKALESAFSDFKHTNKKELAYRHLAQCMIGKRSIEDMDVFRCIVELVEIYTEHWSAAGNSLLETVAPMLKVFARPYSVFYGSPEIFSIVSYFLILYERIKEVKDLKLPALLGSKVAEGLGKSQHSDVENRFAEILNVMKEFVAGNMETHEYEEEIQILSDCHGYKLLNVDRVLSKMDNKATALRQNTDNLGLLEDVYKDESKLERVEAVESSENYKFTIEEKTINIEKIPCNSYAEILREIERFRELDFDRSLVRTPMFLKRSIVDFKGGKCIFNMEHRICVKTMKLKYIAGTEDFFIRNGVGRQG